MIAVRVCWISAGDRFCYENRIGIEQPRQARRAAGHARPLGVELVRQADLGVGEAEEPHRTFVENALAKARFASQHTGLPALADDAGLCVDALAACRAWTRPTTPRSLATKKGDDNNVRALLEQMQGQANRRAAMVSTLVAVRSPQDPEP